MKTTLPSALLSMSDAQQLFGLTARALRFYEERGLIEAQRNRLNCRFFDAVARRRLALIAPLRQAGVPMPEVRRVLDAEEAGSAGDAAALRALERRRHALIKDLAQVDLVHEELARHSRGADGRLSSAA